MYCIVLYCIVLYCIVLYCIVLYCIVLYCIVLYCIVLYCIVLYCIVLYCIVSCRNITSCGIVSYRIVLETKSIFMFYLFNQIILPFHFSSTMFVQKSFKFSITAISSSYDMQCFSNLTLPVRRYLVSTPSTKGGGGG